MHGRDEGPGTGLTQLRTAPGSSSLITEEYQHV